MAMFLLNGSSLDNMIGLLQGLVAPIFAPVLMAITNLLRQFGMLVTNPLRCVVDVLNSLLALQNGGKLPAGGKQPEGFNSGITQLRDQLLKAITTVDTKTDFYVGQVKAMMGELGGGDGAYLSLKLESLRLIRLISFVIAIINALVQGHVVCDTAGRTPEATELDNFFANYLNPTQPFNVWISPDGVLHVDEKTAGFEDAIKKASDDVPLPEFGNVLKFEGSPLLTEPTDLTTAVRRVSSVLSTPVQAVVPCSLQVEVSDVEKINRWIAGLNQI